MVFAGIGKKALTTVLTKPGYRSIIIPEKKEVGVRVVANNLRTAKMSLEKYFELLDDA